MFIEDKLIQFLVASIGSLCLLYGVWFLLCVLFIVWTVVRLPRLEKRLEQEDDERRRKMLTKKISYWIAVHESIERGAEKRGVYMPPEILLRVLLEKYSHVITRALLLCLIGTASLVGIRLLRPMIPRVKKHTAKGAASNFFTLRSGLRAMSGFFLFLSFLSVTFSTPPAGGLLASLPSIGGEATDFGMSAGAELGVANALSTKR